MSSTSSQQGDEHEEELEEEPLLLTRSQVMDYLLSCLRLEDMTIAHIKTVIGINSSVSLLMMSDQDLRNAVDHDAFTVADCSALKALKQWLARYRSEHIVLPTGNEWRSVFNEDIFINFLVAGISTGLMATTIGQEQGSMTPIARSAASAPFRGRLSDYPECTGRSRDWYNFKAKFEGTAGGQDCYEVLLRYPPGDPILQDPSFLTKSRFIFAVLKRSSAYGLVKDTIRPHQANQDGNAAWLDLVEDMETQGNVGQLVAENTNELAQVKLRFDSRGGFATYKQDFCALCQRLEDAGEGMSELMKKTFFLMNIQDEAYTSIKTTCRSDSAISFKDTVQKIKAEAKAMGKLEDSRSANRTASAVKRKPLYKSRSPRPKAMRNSMQARDTGDNKFPYIPHHIWKQLSDQEAQRYKDTWNNQKTSKPPNRGIGHQYPRLKHNAAVKVDKKLSPSETPSNNGQIWRSLPRKANTFRTMRLVHKRFNCSIRNPDPSIAPPAHEKDVSRYEDSSYDESFHTTSTLGSDSEVWFDDDQDSIATKPQRVCEENVHQDNPGKAPTEVKAASDSSSSEDEDEVRDNDVLMQDVDPTGPEAGPAVVIKIEQVDSDDDQAFETPRKLPRICGAATASTASEDSNVEESITSVRGYSNPTEQNDQDWYLARQLFPRSASTKKDEDISSQASYGHTKTVSFAANDPSPTSEDEWPSVPEGTSGPWYGIDADILSGPTSTNDFDYVQEKLVTPSFIEYLQFETKEGARSYVRNRWSQIKDTAIMEGRASWYKGDLPYTVFIQYLMGLLPLEFGQGFCARCGTRGIVDDACLTCAYSCLNSGILSLQELSDATRTTTTGDLQLTKISCNSYSYSIKGYEPRMSPPGYVSWYKTSALSHQRTGPKTLLVLPHERGAIRIYNSNTQAAPSTRLYTQGISQILTSLKNEQNEIIAFHIQTNALERVTVSTSDAYAFDSERVYTYLFANKELGLHGVERWRRHDVMRIISHRMAPFKESPTVIAFLCEIVNTHSNHHRIELPLALARECNEREVIGYIFEHDLEYCSGTQWIRNHWPIFYDQDSDDGADLEPARAVNALTCRFGTPKIFVKYNQNQLQRSLTSDIHHALLDSGADTSGLGGDIWTEIKKTGRHAGILAYNNELLMEEVPIVSATAAHDLPDSTTILLHFNEATLLGGKSNTLISPTQLRDNGVRVDDVPARYGGNQSILLDGLLIPLLLQDGMLTLPLRRATDYELRTCERYHLTSGRHEWAPQTLNGETLTSEQYAVQTSAIDVRVVSNCNLFSSYLRRLTVSPSQNDWVTYQSYLLDCNEETTKKTLESTTRLADLSGHFPAKQHRKSRFPWANVLRLNETCATDTVFSTVTSYEGYNCMQWFAFNHSHYQKEYGMRSEGSGPNALLDFFRDIGAPTSMRRDNSKMQTSDLWEQYLRQYNVRNEFIEPYHSSQNPAERQLAIHKQRMKGKMITTGCDPRAWFKLSRHITSLNNRIARKSINWRTPYELLYGSTPDISPFVIFEFWEPVYYTDLNTPFPNNQEKIGRFMGIAEEHGDGMCFWILTNETEQLIVRSYLRSAKDTTKPNASLLSDHIELKENDQKEIKERTESEYKLPMYHAGQLSPTGTLLLKKGEQQAQLILDEEELANGTTLNFDPRDVVFNINPEDLIDKLIKVDGKPTGVVRQRMDDENFRIEYKDGKQDMLTYNELIEALNRPNEEDEERWTYDEIISHRSKKVGPNKYEKQVLIKWDTGELSWEPLLSIKKDDPVTLAQYAQRKNLLEQSSWNWAKRFVKNATSFRRYYKHMQLAKRKRRRTRFKFGQRLPRTIKEAQELDLQNKNTKWQDAIDKEIKLLVETYGCFKVLGKGEKPPKNHEFIPIIWVFDIKVDGRYRPRAVAGGHVTEGDPEDGHAVMADLETVRLAIVAAALFELKVFAADVSHAYIQAYTKEQVYTVAGPEFGRLEGLVFVIVKALYGLRTSGARWAEKLNDTLRSLGFTKSNAGSALWIRRKDDHYEYMSTLVDDILIYSKNPQEIIKILETIYDLRGIGIPDYYSGADWYCDKDGDVCLSAKTYVKNICEKIEKLFDVKLKNYGSPLESGDHPEMDESVLLTGEEISLYQMLVGSGQWAVTLARFDVQFAINSMARFSNAPREGHMKRMLRVFGYLKYHEKARIKFDVTVPIYDGLEFKDYDWSQQYPDAEEEIHPDAPEPLKTKYPASITCYCDADHAHCLETRRSVTGVLLFVNKTPIKWYSKRQNTVESSTYGSELVAARIAGEIIIDFRGRLRLLGIEVIGPSVLLIDNQSVVANMTLPSGSLKKKHNSIAFHKVRFLVSAGVIIVAHIRGNYNVADVETKAVSAMVVWYLLSMLLYGRECTYDSEPEGELQKSMCLCKPVYVDLGDLTPVPGRVESSPGIQYTSNDTTVDVRRMATSKSVRRSNGIYKNYLWATERYLWATERSFITYRDYLWASEFAKKVYVIYLWAQEYTVSHTLNRKSTYLRTRERRLCLSSQSRRERKHNMLLPQFAVTAKTRVPHLLQRNLVEDNHQQSTFHLVPSQQRSQVSSAPRHQERLSSESPGRNLWRNVWGLEACWKGTINFLWAPELTYRDPNTFSLSLYRKEKGAFALTSLLKRLSFIRKDSFMIDAFASFFTFSSLKFLSPKRKEQGNDVKNKEPLFFVQSDFSFADVATRLLGRNKKV